MVDLKEFDRFVAASISSFLVLNKLLCSPHTNDGIPTNIGCRLCRVNLGSSNFSNDYNSYTDSGVSSCEYGCKTLLLGCHSVVRVPSRTEEYLSGDGGCF